MAKVHARGAVPLRHYRKDGETTPYYQGEMLKRYMKWCLRSDGVILFGLFTVTTGKYPYRTGHYAAIRKVPADVIGDRDAMIAWFDQAATKNGAYRVDDRGKRVDPVTA